tara:strand:- start:1147 stop:2067 length:921 start_codon:yes stop_codon:yes gene_type:complete
MSDNTKTDIAVYEEIHSNKDLIVQSEFKLPMSRVFANTVLGNVESFGNRTVSENAQLVDLAFQNTDDLHNIWNRSHTQWTWKHINMSHSSDIHNMRQIAAEMSGKKAALQNAKWITIRNEVAVKKLEEKLEKGYLEYWEEVDIKLELAQKKEGLREGFAMIEGAMKDVLALNEIYEQLKNRVSNFDEHDFELAEPMHQMKKSLTQCIRDIRQGGYISKGEQEFLEQIGANVSKIQKLLREFVQKEEEDEHWDNRMQISFIDKLANELVNDHRVTEVRAAMYGFEETPIEDHSQNSKVALLEDNKEK